MQHHRCLADIGGPFYDPNKPFRNWSALPFYQLDIPQPPYVDRVQLAQGITRAKQHLEHIHHQGYTGIVIDNLAHLVSFERAPFPIYPSKSPYRQRAVIYRSMFGQVFERAAQLNMEVFVTSDMQWSTPPVRRYIGRLEAENPRIDEVNCWALEELFTMLPQVSGLFVRVGEVGGAHNQGTAYTGHLIYRNVPQLRRLIGALLPVCEKHKRLLVVRTWSIGIGALGDLLWSSDRYRELFRGFDSAHLLAAIKHGPSDFFRMLPHNPTLGLPGPAQIVELQNRREYELFGMVPSAVVPLHQETIQHALTTNDRFAGIWAWNSSGGWGGGQAALGEDGWSVWTELSSALTAAILRTPDLDSTAFAHDWCNARFGPRFGEAVSDIYLDSASLIEQGWYLGNLKPGQPTLGSVIVPPLLWVWWMRPTAAPLVWAYLVSMLQDSERAIREGAAACDRLRQHVDRLLELQSFGGPSGAAIVDSVRYMHDVLLVAQAIRTLMLRSFTAVWKNKRSRWDAAARTTGPVRTIIRHHRLVWGERSDLPPLELDEIEAFLGQLEHAPGSLWYAARTACALVKQLHTGALPMRRVYTAGAITVGILALALAQQGHRRIGLAGVLASGLLATPLRGKLLQSTLPWINRRLHLLPSMFFEAGPGFGEWAA